MPEDKQSEAEEAVIHQYAQYMADHMDTTIVLMHTEGMCRECAFKRATVVLETDGYRGRVYPVGFFNVTRMMEEISRA